MNPLLIHLENFLQALSAGLFLGGLYGLMCVGLGIIFGVMLTENAQFVSKARSNVGAVGLMQVYPKVWATKEMSALLGKDIATDSTNVKYGVFMSVVNRLQIDGYYKIGLISEEVQG